MHLNFTLIILHYKISELKEMIEKISTREIDGSTVTVEMVKASKPCIRIYNLSICDKDMLKYYFSRPEKSGGGEVESVRILDEKEAIVTFSDVRGIVIFKTICGYIAYKTICLE